VTPSLGNPPPAASASTESAPPAPASGPLLTLREAVRSTLRKHPAIAQARATLAARSADLLAAGAPFDPVVSSSLAHNREAQALLPPDRAAPAERALLEDATSFRLGASAGFQWGMTVIPSVTLERVKAQRNPNPLGFPDAASQRARADLKVLQPLLRGRGTDGAASGLRAAARAREAAEESAGHAAQAQVFDTIATYYRWVAASSDLQRFVESVARAQKLFDETRVLVEAEHRPRADLRQVEASLENQRRGMLEAENNVALARYDLGLAMGLDGSEVPEWQAVDGFPAARVPELSADATIERALHARRDLHAADQSVASSSALLAGAERNALPALDLGVSVGYAGALDKDGIGPFFGATVRNVPGVNAGASLTLELPVSNDAARATRDLRRAEQAGAQIARADLDRQIRSGVRSALSEVRLSAAALGAAQHAVELLTQAVVDERDKLHEGLSTIIDVVLTEERLTQAELTRTAQQLRFTTALARLQFESGALPETESTLAASPEALLTPEALHAGQ
jgi:outer membrane protein TolC